MVGINKSSTRVQSQINSVEELMATFSPSNFPNWNGPLILRGESKEYEFPLQPTISRDDAEFLSIPVLEESPSTYITNEEIEVIDAFQRTLPEDYLHYVNRVNEDDINLLFLARHYGIKTRLVDVTYNPLVALYFCCSSNPEEAGYLYFMVNTTEVQNLHIDTDNYKKAFDFAIESHMQHRDAWRHLNFLYTFPYANSRVNSQKGGFLFNLDPRKNLIDGTIVYEVPAARKSHIVKHLEFLNITSESLGLG